MESIIPVFDLTGLKTFFLRLLVINVAIVGATVLLNLTLSGPVYPDLFTGRKSLFVFLFIILLSFLFSTRIKKKLQGILQETVYEKKISRYETYYKKRVVWNTFSLVLNGGFFLITNKNMFFYFLIFQLCLSVLQYPGKKLIATELKDADILFT